VPPLEADMDTAQAQSGKKGGRSYFRLAIRNTADNDRHLKVLREELK